MKYSLKSWHIDRGQVNNPSELIKVMIKVTGDKKRLITFSFGNRELENSLKKLSKTAS